MGKRYGDIGLIALLVLLAGCGTTTAVGAAGTPISTPIATALPTATPLPTITSGGPGCGQSLPAHAVLVGGLAIAQQTSFGNLAYPSAKLAEGLPLAPYKVQQGTYPPGPPSGPPVDPVVLERGGGYVTDLCNASSTPHTVQAVQTRIASITPYTGQLDTWPPCQAPYSRQNGGRAGGCGGADGENIALHAPFQPSDGVGATVTAQQLYINPAGPNSPFGVKMPATLQPGEALTIEVGMGNDQSPFFMTPGYYTFSFAFAVDGATPVFASTSPATLLARPAHVFTGSNRLAPAMQQQIPPASNPPTYYICPES
jgi:hypothetical protein